jgi:transcriptional regulator with XRE-family HTH domain
VSNFPEKLRQAMYEKRRKAAHVAKGTGISPSVLSRYLSGRNKPSSDNILTISQYLNVTPEWLLSSSDASEFIQSSKGISSSTDSLLKVIEVQGEFIKNLQKQVGGLEKEVKAWEDIAATISEKKNQKTKNPTKPNKQKVGFMKKHKPKK